MRIARTFASVFALSVLVASVGCSDSSEDAPAAASADHEKEATAAVKKYIDENLTALNAAALELQAAAPAPDADGWNAQTDAASVEAMRKAWYKARVAYEHIEGAIAVLFPEIDVSTDERYDAFVLDSPDDDLFDDQGVTGIHGIERILWSNQIPQVVVDFESKLKGPGGASVYKKAAFPANEAEARAFKEKLCGRLVADTKKMQTEFAPLALDLSAAYRGVVGSMREQVEKVKKAASGEEESRYAQYTGADLRANVEGGKVIYGAFRPWVLDRGAEGRHVDGEIMDAFARVEAAYATIPGDALPPVPATWSQTPSEADLATPFGKIYKVLVTESDEKTDGSLVHDMNEAAALIALPEQ